MDRLALIRDKPIIQGGMGFGVSGHNLARTVSCNGQLGVISATAPNLLLIRGLQNGDPTGELRDALAQFPNRDIAERIVERFFIEGGKDPNDRYDLETFPKFERIDDTKFQLLGELEDTLVAGAFVEVHLAKRGHDNPIGANFLNKIELAQLPTLYGAMLAGVDAVLIGAGFPRDIPDILTAFTSGNVGKMSVPVSGKPYQLVFDPERFVAKDLQRPVFLGIVGNHLGAKALPHADGYVFEGPIAGGHNPPARSKEVDGTGQPVYGPKDDMNFALLAAQLEKNASLRGGQLQPYWLAGSYATRLAEARSHGASGVQVGTPFGYCRESGIAPELKHRALDAILAGATVYTDPRASPTGFPFKVLQVPGTLADQEVYEARKRKCDLGYLVEIYESPEGKIATRCPSEPESTYKQRGGKVEDIEGRKCICNALTATIGLGMPGEKPILTSGADLTAVKALVERHGRDYSATQVIAFILAQSSTPPEPAK